MEIFQLLERLNELERRRVNCSTFPTYRSNNQRHALFYCTGSSYLIKPHIQSFHLPWLCREWRAAANALIRLDQHCPPTPAILLVHSGTRCSAIYHANWISADAQFPVNVTKEIPFRKDAAVLCGIPPLWCKSLAPLSMEMENRLPIFDHQEDPICMLLRKPHNGTI